MKTISFRYAFPYFIDSSIGMMNQIGFQSKVRMIEIIVRGWDSRERKAQRNKKLIWLNRPFA